MMPPRQSHGEYSSLTRREFLRAGSSAVAAIALGQNNLLSRSHLTRQPVDYVNPLIGTTAPGLRWMMFPGVSLPFGMVKLSPDNKAWSGRAGSGRAGYDYKIPTILGFSHIHSWTMGGLLMLFVKFDHGGIIDKGAGKDGRRVIRLLIGNPLIMAGMARNVPDAGSYAPVTVLIDERSDGVHLSYDRMSSFLAPYGNSDALRIASDLDAKIEMLLQRAIA